MKRTNQNLLFSLSKLSNFCLKKKIKKLKATPVSYKGVVSVWKTIQVLRCAHLLTSYTSHVMTVESLGFSFVLLFSQASESVRVCSGCEGSLTALTRLLVPQRTLSRCEMGCRTECLIRVQNSCFSDLRNRMLKETIKINY